MTFSIDGATAESYAKYRQRGNFAKAIGNLRAAADEKRRAGRDVPFINWRYILFTHNDSDEEMSLARTMAAEMGVDRLCWELTDHPEDMFSRRFAPAAPRTPRSATRSGTTTTSATPSPARPRARRSGSRVRCPGPAAIARARTPRAADHARSRNRSTRPFAAQASYGRRLVRLGAQLCRRDGALMNRDFERAWLPADAAARRLGAGADDHHRAGRAGTLPAEVRHGQRRDRLVRGVRIADDVEDAGVI